MIPGLLLVLAVPLLIQAQSLPQLDQQLTRHLQGRNRHPLPDIIFESLALGSPLIQAGSCAYGYRSGPPDRTRSQLLVLASTQVSAGVLKYTIRRHRPDSRYQPRLWNTRITPAFPSGHASLSAANAAFMAAHYPETRPLLIPLMLLSGYSQVYVGNHYLSDVLGGWLLGLTLGYAGYLLTRTGH